MMPLFYFAMHSIQLENFSISFDKNIVSSSFVAVWDNSVFSGTFEIFVVSVL